MKKTKLKPTGVILDDSHRYWAAGKELHGITGLIKRHVFPDMYEGVSEKVLDAKKEYGTMVHEALEVFDEFGTRSEEFATEVNAYEVMKSLNNVEVLQSEYIVTDYERYATPIDKVIMKDGRLAIADVKTTYTLNKKYVSWQLSICKYLFGLVNPKLKIEGLYAIHVKDGMVRLVEVEEVPAEDVQRLLEADARGEVATFDNKVTIAIDEKKALALIGKIAANLAKKQEIEESIERFETQLKAMCEGLPTFKIDNDMFTLTKTADYERMSFDSKMFAEEHPALFEQYKKKTLVKGGIKYKLK